METLPVEESFKKRALSDEQADFIVIVGGSTYPEHAETAAQSIKTNARDVELKMFPNGELHTEYKESVRGKQVFIVNTDFTGKVIKNDNTEVSWSVNDSIQQTILLVDAAVRASAKEVTVIKPHFAYARQDRKRTGREPVSAVAHILQLQSVGMDRLMTIDLHSTQIGAIERRYDNLPAANRLANSLTDYCQEIGIDLENIVFFAPDGGSLHLPTYFRDHIGYGQVNIIEKMRDSNGNVSHNRDRVEGVGGRVAVIVDDMIDTGGTLNSAAEILLRSGAKRVIVAATHGLFSDPAFERLQDSEIEMFIITDTVPQERTLEALSERVRVVEIGTLIGKGIFEVATNGSVSKIYKDGKPYRR